MRQPLATLKNVCIIEHVKIKNSDFIEIFHLSHTKIIPTHKLIGIIKHTKPNLADCKG